MNNTFGKLTISDHGKRMLAEAIEGGETPEIAAFRLFGESAIQLALWKRPVTQMTVKALQVHLENGYLPEGTKATITYDGIFLGDVHVLDRLALQIVLTKAAYAALPQPVEEPG